MTQLRRRRLPVLLLAVGVLGAVARAEPAQAKGCAESLGPLETPPAALWGELQPVRILIDDTNWTGSQRPSLRDYQISTSVDIENGWIFQSHYDGFSIWDARTDAANPQRVAQLGGFEGQIPGWPTAGEFTQVVFYVDVPEGDDTAMAMVGFSGGMGLTLWDTSNKANPREIYQDPRPVSYQVYSARINGRDYAFAGDFDNGGPLGVHAYDITAAKALGGNGPCRQTGNNCQGVYLGRIGNAEATKYVSGLAVGNQHFLVRSGGDISGTGISIWNITNPQAPTLVVDDFRGFANGSTHGVTMWSQNGRHYLAARRSGNGNIFDITSCLTTGCVNLSSLQIWSRTLQPYPESTYWLSATFSRSGTTPFVYFGNHDTCRQAEPAYRTEYLMDVSDPANPRDTTPPAHILDLGESVDYWSWYYSDVTRGWAHFGPRVAKFSGDYLYRAAATVFDIHKWMGSPVTPVAGFGWSPTVIYPGDPVTFTDASTGNVSSRQWTFQSGTAAAAAPAAAAPPPAVPPPH